MDFSAAAWAFEWAPPCEDAIRAIADLGFAGVELRIQGRGELAYYSDETNKALRALMDEKNLRLTSLNFTPEGASSLKAEERRTAVEDFRRVAAVAGQLGTGLITIGPSYPAEAKHTDEHYKPSMQVWNTAMPEGVDLVQNYEDYLETLRGFAAVCREHGLKMAVEPVPNAWIRNTDAVLRLLEKPGFEDVGVTYDVANISMIGDIAEIFVYRVGRRICNVQMADNHGVNNAHWRPGKGKNDFGAIVRALADVGYQGPVCLELSDAEGAGRSPAALYDPHADYEKLSRSHKLAVAELERIYSEEGV